MVNECCLAGETWHRQHDGIRINKLEDTFCRRIFSAAPLQGQTWRSARQIAMPKTENELKLALIRANGRETSIRCGFVFKIRYTDLQGLPQRSITDALWVIYSV